jgi:2-polyprenyl-3-methyl-5-hydroxy-6-metoxy-1,4-benzoquinol methylase
MGQQHAGPTANDVDRARSPASASAYLLDNAGEPTRRRFAGLPQVYDPGTMRHLTERGLGPGWHCLEVGAGGGSIARWLAEQVGPAGSVLATDIDTRFLDDLQMPNLEVRRHDIGTEPLSAASFDLAHARLVLSHVPQREAALARLDDPTVTFPSPLMWAVWGRRPGA